MDTAKLKENWPYLYVFAYCVIHYAKHELSYKYYAFDIYNTYVI